MQIQACVCVCLCLKKLIGSVMVMFNHGAGDKIETRNPGV